MLNQSEANVTSHDSMLANQVAHWEPGRVRYCGKECISVCTSACIEIRTDSDLPYPPQGTGDSSQGAAGSKMAVDTFSAPPCGACREPMQSLLRLMHVPSDQLNGAVMLVKEVADHLEFLSNDPPGAASCLAAILETIRVTGQDYEGEDDAFCVLRLDN